MKEMWNKRYSREEYVYGKEPNSFLKEELELMNPGKILLPGEGEGRNAVYAAKLGWETVAFDYSEVAGNKAMQLASEMLVDIIYHTESWKSINLKAQSFDLIAVFFLHLPPEEQSLFHKKVMQWLKPDGIFIAEYFSRKQLNMDSGGPKNPDLLYDIENLRNDFKDLIILKAEEKLIFLDSGDFHQGNAWINQLKIANSTKK